MLLPSLSLSPSPSLSLSLLPSALPSHLPSPSPLPSLSLSLLPSALPCDGIECGAGTVRSVLVNDTAGGPESYSYYTFVHPPCVRLALFEGKAASVMGTFAQCADPASPHSAAATCCADAGAGAPVSSYSAEARFVNEMVSYETAEARCASLGGAVCADYVPTLFGPTPSPQALIKVPSYVHVL